MNVDEYLARIGYNGSREPTISTLKDLSYCQKNAVMFSNLQLFGGERIKLNLKEMYNKIIVNKQPGICFELNGLFVWLLRQLGFNASLAQTRFYEESSWPGFRAFSLVDFGKEGKYFVDTAFLLFGPMKLKVMKPYVDSYNIFRFRLIPDEKNWYIFERHKKTVLDANGSILKQGPAPPGVANGMCDDECKRENSTHWTIVYKICSEPLELEDFEESCNRHQDDPNGMLKSNIILLKLSGKFVRTIMGTTCYIKESINPVTTKILHKSEIQSNEEIVKIARDIFGHEIELDVKFFNKHRQHPGRPVQRVCAA